MVNNKKYFIRMLSLALFAWAASAFVKGVVSDEDMFNKYLIIKKNEQADKKWVNLEIMKDVSKNVGDTPHIMKVLGKDPNMLLKVDEKLNCEKAHNVLGYASDVVVNNAGTMNGECNTEVIEVLLYLGGDPEAKSAWKRTNSALDIVDRLIDENNKRGVFPSDEVLKRLGKQAESKRFSCAKKLKKIFSGIIDELTEEAKTRLDYKYYSDVQKATQNLEKHKKLLEKHEKLMEQRQRLRESRKKRGFL